MHQCIGWVKPVRNTSCQLGLSLDGIALGVTGQTALSDLDSLHGTAVGGQEATHGNMVLGVFQVR